MFRPGILATAVLPASGGRGGRTGGGAGISEGKVRTSVRHAAFFRKMRSVACRRCGRRSGVLPGRARRFAGVFSRKRGGRRDVSRHGADRMCLSANAGSPFGSDAAFFRMFSPVSMFCPIACCGFIYRFGLFLFEFYKQKESTRGRNHGKRRKKRGLYIVFPKKCVSLQAILDNGNRFFNH